MTCASFRFYVSGSSCRVPDSFEICANVEVAGILFSALCRDPLVSRVAIDQDDDLLIEYDAGAWWQQRDAEAQADEAARSDFLSSDLLEKVAQERMALFRAAPGDACLLWFGGTTPQLTFEVCEPERPHIVNRFALDCTASASARGKTGQAVYICTGRRDNSWPALSGDVSQDDPGAD